MYLKAYPSFYPPIRLPEKVQSVRQTPKIHTERLRNNLFVVVKIEVSSWITNAYETAITLIMYLLRWKLPLVTAHPCGAGVLVSAFPHHPSPHHTHTRRKQAGGTFQSAQDTCLSFQGQGQAEDLNSWLRTSISYLITFSTASPRRSKQRRWLRRCRRAV